RSGRFSQCTGKLHKDGGYCCLGVACMTARRLEIDDANEVDNPYASYPGRWFERLFMQKEGAAWNPMLSDGNVSHCASNWNDERGADFNKIADMLEANYLRPTGGAA